MVGAFVCHEVLKTLLGIVTVAVLQDATSTWVWCWKDPDMSVWNLAWDAGWDGLWHLSASIEQMQEFVPLLGAQHSPLI